MGTWSNAWRELGRLAEIYDARDIAAAAHEMAVAQQRGALPPEAMRSETREVLEILWPGKTLTISEGAASEHRRPARIVQAETKP